MKILFLQNLDDAQGGIVTVNKTLAEVFLAQGDQVIFLSLRHSRTHSDIVYPSGAETILIDGERVWGCPRLSTALAYCRKGRIGSALRVVGERIRYNHWMQKDLRACRYRLEALCPDIIINSHYELLDAVPPPLLPRTVNHFHTSFDQVGKIRSYRKTFQQYRDKLGRFVWLSESSCQAAKQAGIPNSCYIYNPLSFSSERQADPSVHKAVFIGRFSAEKRLALALEQFQAAVTREDLTDWELDVYGIGALDEKLLQTMERHPRIHYRGSTDDPRQVLLDHSLFLMTSSFEGMALVILEANECGVPVIAFRFGETAEEEIQNGQTGVLVGQDDFESYQRELCALMRDEKRRAELGNQAKQFAAQFRADAIGRQWYRLFAEIRES